VCEERGSGASCKSAAGGWVAFGGCKLCQQIHVRPPPCIRCQGYKFNIFYPELLDKTVAPTYKVDKDPTSPDGEQAARMAGGVWGWVLNRPPNQVVNLHASAGKECP